MTEQVNAAVSDVLSIMVFSDDANTRKEIVTAIGGRVSSELPKVVCTEIATPDMVLIEAREKNFDLLILDGEAPKLGGMGLGKMVHDEIDANIPFILYVARPQDEWLGRWSGASKILSYPVEPRSLVSAIVDVLN